MNREWIRRMILVSVLAGVVFAAGCWPTSPDGTYKDAQGAVTLELKGGKANLNFGGIQMNATYAVDGNKLTLTQPDDKSQTLVFTINKDGSLDAPPGSMMPRLQKVK